jgi:hypothetical protein
VFSRNVNFPGKRSDILHTDRRVGAAMSDQDRRGVGGIALTFGRRQATMESGIA